jgi:hypothetical protein
VTAGGDHKVQEIKGTTPPISVTPKVMAKDLYADGAVRLASSVGWEPIPNKGTLQAGLVGIGDRLYDSSYMLDMSGDALVGPPVLRLIGGGWSQHRYVEQSKYYNGLISGRQNAHALAGDTLTRWTVTPKSGWQNRKAYTGFASVKTMALISQTATYDTFLANTYGGALYTIRVYTTGTAAPVVKKVRASTWQSFDAFVAVKCGTQSTLLLAIDKDTKTGRVYAVGHANGTATLIQGLGPVATTFPDPHYFRFFTDTPESGNLFGE